MLNTLRNILLKLMLVFSMPALIAQPIESTPFPQSRVVEQVLSYDEIIELINKVESGELEQRDSDKERCQVNKILALLAKAGGVFDEDEEQCFQNTIASLLDTPTDGSNFQFQIGDLPGLICDINSLEPFKYKIDGTQICDTFLLNDFDQCLYTPCGWAGNAWKKTKKFLAKYKTEIIIGAAVVVAAVIIFSTMGTATAPVEALTSATQIKTEPTVPAVEEIEYKIPLFTGKEEAFLFPKESSQQLDFSLTGSQMQEFFDVKGLHEHALYSPSCSIQETIREAMAYEMHIAVDILAENYNYAPLIDSTPAPLTGLYGILQQQYFNQTGETHLATKLYDTGVEYCHKAIDFVFSTDQANAFSPEEKAKNSWNYSDLSLFLSPKGIIKGSHFLDKTAKNFFIKAEKAIKPYTKSNLRLGQKIHQSYKAAICDLKLMRKEFKLPSGRRIDFLDIMNGKVYELKPNNPRAIRAGMKQLDAYIKELKQIPEFKNTNWEGILEIY